MTNSRIDDQERIRRIEIVGKYFLDTGSSTRDIADYISKNHFDISNKTVSVYIKKYAEIHPDKSDEISELINNNTEKSIEDPEVRERVFKVARSILDGHTIEETSEILGVSAKTVERDISPRLELLSKEDEDMKAYYDAVLNSLHIHQINALDNNRNISIKK